MPPTPYWHWGIMRRLDTRNDFGIQIQRLLEGFLTFLSCLLLFPTQLYFQPTERQLYNKQISLSKFSVFSLTVRETVKERQSLPSPPIRVPKPMAYDTEVLRYMVGTYPDTDHFKVFS